MSGHVVLLDAPDDFDGWRAGARAAVLAGVSPQDIAFRVAGGEEGLFDGGGATLPEAPANAALTVPKAFVDVAGQVVCHSEPERFALLYRLLLRLQGDRTLMQQPADRDVHRANVLAKEIRRDAHKMKAFVRFRKTGETADGVETFAAWFEPTHHIVRHTAPFFMRRFAGMHWSILTPKGCAHWVAGGRAADLTFTAAVPKSEAPADDALEDYWRSYYASIFNPARLKLNAMQSEMPKKYWHNLPEAALIPQLVKDAQSRETRMRDAEPTLPLPGMMKHKETVVEENFPDRDAIQSLDDLHAALKGCTACPLYKPATQVVPGKGPVDARLMMVGEQPGDKEDLAGEPFIGPAGTLLRELMAEVDLNPDEAYVTNAVKHFKFEPRGKRRIHQNPSTGEIDTCKWWLNKEIELVRPQIIMALGGSAVRALTGRTQTIKSLRGAVHTLDDAPMREGRNAPTELVVANHPSFILRVPHEGAKRDARAGLLEDLRTVRNLLAA